MDIRERWAQTTGWLDELPPRWAGLAGFCVFLGAGLVVLRLPSWGFVGGLLGLLLLLVWLALSGQPVVKLVFAPEAAAALQVNGSPKEPAPSPPVSRRPSELLEMVELSGGEFWMGEAESRHRVRVSEFAMAKYPVTQGQYAGLMGKNPSRYQELSEDNERPEDRPVERVSWFDAVRYCNRLSETEGLAPSYRIREPAEGTEAQPFVEWDRASDGYRLATEAEWEYACRSGNETSYSFGDDEVELGDHAWFRANSNGRTQPVGQKRPNDWGLHDLHGNVWEWCWDWYESYNVTYDRDTEVTLKDPIGPSSGAERILRGGAFDSGPKNVRSGLRNKNPPTTQSRFLGFRCVRRPIR